MRFVAPDGVCHGYGGSWPGFPRSRSASNGVGMSGSLIGVSAHTADGVGVTGALVDAPPHTPESGRRCGWIGRGAETPR